MRKHLQEREGERGSYQGTVARFGTKSAFRGPPVPTVMLKDVKDVTGKVVCDHLWFAVGKQIAALELVEGDQVAFDARVTEYVKGYQGYREDVYASVSVDYRLSNPTRVRKLIKQGEQA